MGHGEELKDFQFRMEQIVEKRKCLKMFWSLADVFITICLLALVGFFLWLGLIPETRGWDSDTMIAFGILIALNILFFVMRFTQTIELTLADGSVHLIPIGAFLLGPVNHNAQDRIARFCRRICLDM